MTGGGPADEADNLEKYERPAALHRAAARPCRAMTSTKKTPGGGKFYARPFLCDKAVLNGGDLFSPCAIDVDAREVILKADAAAGGFVEIGSERFAAAPWVSGSGMPYTTVALTKADIARLRRAHVLLALMAETWNDAPPAAPKPSPKVWPRAWNPPS